MCVNHKGNGLDLAIVGLGNVSYLAIWRVLNVKVFADFAYRQGDAITIWLYSALVLKCRF